MDIKHHQKPSKIEFLNEAEIEQELRNMISDNRFNTTSISVRDQDNIVKKIDFFDKHSTYLITHPKIDPKLYLLNLKTMTRIRG